jgi:hypothetical protein
MSSFDLSSAIVHGESSHELSHDSASRHGFSCSISNPPDGASCGELAFGVSSHVDKQGTRSTLTFDSLPEPTNRLA